MANFQIYESCTINKNGVRISDIINHLKTNLSKYYQENDIQITTSGITINGNLKGFWERAITKAEIKIEIKDSLLKYSVDGSASLGKWPWVWFCLGLFTGFFFIWFLVDLIEFLLSRDRPKNYFLETFTSLKIILL